MRNTEFELVPRRAGTYYKFMLRYRYLKPALVLPLALLLWAGSAWSQPGRVMYRYYNEQGTMVVGYQVPAEYVKNGYEVLNEEGVVVRVVPRALTAEERARRDAEKLQDQAAEEEAERLRQWDESLLLRYSTVEDIEAARERGLRDLRIRVSILKGNQRSLKKQVENYQAQAADQERRGQAVDITQLNAIEDLQGEIAATERAITDRLKEIEEVSASYQRDIDRFEQLLEVVALRRAMLAADK